MSAAPYPLDFTMTRLFDRVNGKGSQWLPVFLEYAKRVPITSKDFVGEPQPLEFYRSQEMVLEFICDGLDNDVHDFNFLKARQLGCTTVLQMLDIFWLDIHPSTQGALVMDSGDNRENARSLITEMLENVDPDFRVPYKTNNRAALLLDNGSRLQYMSAGKRKNSGLGRSRALSFAHLSELCEYGDREGLDVMKAAFSTENPNRLYVKESTAKGFGLWYEIYEDGKDDPTQRCHFIGWWAKYTRDEFGHFKSGYFFAQDTENFARYWGQYPRHTQYEERITAEVLARYGEQIEPEQWAYYRWLATQRGGSSLRAEYPSVEEEAWQETGNPFFPATQIGQDEQFITTHDVRFNAYRCELGAHFADLKVIPCTDAKDVELRVWEEPRIGARYLIGCDPAYGSSETADRSVISVWRAFADKLVQVAEYATEKPSAQQCAWVLAYLGACYRDCRINLEINGPGGSIMEEIKHLKLSVRIGELSTRMAQIGKTSSLDGITWFLYHRVDSMGAGFAWNWKTSASTKPEMMNSMFICYSSNQLIIRSIPLLHEMRTMVQDGDSISGRSGTKDDRVIGAALANIAWLKWERPALMGQNRTYERDMAEESQRKDAQTGNVSYSIMDSIVPNYFKQMEAQVTAAKMRKLLEG
jgi:hypothetical protein